MVSSYRYIKLRSLLIMMGCILLQQSVVGQMAFQLKFKKSSVYAGIEVGSKGVKMSCIEIGKNAQQTGAYHLLKDTAVNTDFISFTPATATATLQEFYSLYQLALNQYHIPSERIYTVISSGVKVQSEKAGKESWVTTLLDSFRLRIGEPNRAVEVISPIQEARLSHLGIVPESRRYNTFLIDIGSGNAKGGYFPDDNTKNFRLFELSWGTKSVSNATEKKCGEDRSIANFQKLLYRVLAGSASEEITYAVNVSNAFNMSDNIAVSGGIAWSVANLLFPELINNPVVPVTYEEVLRLSDRIAKNYSSLHFNAIAATVTDKTIDKVLVAREIKKVHEVFDQRSLLAGIGLMLKIMRQFEGLYDKKQFFLVKNGQVGWISAYVDQHIPAP
jgi:hypothetical protein